MAVDRAIPAPGGPLKLRTMSPPTINGVYLHLHGGGWTLGAAHHTDVVLEQLAKQTQLAVASVEYRLAPKYHATATGMPPLAGVGNSALPLHELVLGRRPDGSVAIPAIPVVRG